MNDALWQFINALGWAYWMPFVLLAGANMALLAMMSAPATSLGRTARVCAWVAHLPMLFTPWLNALGCIALPLLLIASNILYLQLYLACRGGIMSVNRKFWSEKVLHSMVQKQ